MEPMALLRKRCTRCQVEKPHSEFHKRLDGLQPCCKDCVRIYSAAYRERNLGEIRAYDRQRSGRMKTPEARARMRIYGKRWRIKNRGHKSPTTGLQYGAKTPAAARAHSAVHRAIQKGVLIRPAICPSCGGDKSRIEASHANYSKPLDVQWLCASCHRTKDSRGNGKGGWVRFAVKPTVPA